MGKRIAFVINAFAESDLRGLVRDVSKIFTILTDPQMGMCENRGKPYHDCRSRSEFHEFFSPILENWNVSDQLLFYFSGHGDIRKGNQYCLKMGINDSDFFPFKSLMNDLEASGVQRAILMLDSCHSGAATQGGTRNNGAGIFSSVTETIPKGIAILASSKKTQTSVELEDGTHGVFTKLLCEGIETGLNGQATHDGYVSVEDIVTYINKSLESNEVYRAYSQRSVFSLHEADRSIWLAKNKSGTSQSEDSKKSIRTSEDLKVLYEQNLPTYYPCISTTLNDLDWNLVTNFFERTRSEQIEIYSKEQVVSMLGLYSPIEYNGIRYLHLSAVLCFCKEPERILPQAKSIFVVGNPKDNFRREDISGSLSSQVKKLLEKSKDYIHKTSFINNDGTRQEVEDLDFELIRELISNSVAHRDYNLNGSIKVSITNEYFEIQSPGKFPAEMTWELLIESSTALSSPVNAAISHYQTHLLVSEGIGRGFQIIKDYINKNGQDSIIFSEKFSFTCIKVNRRLDSNHDDVLKASTSIPHNLPRSGVVKFVGRDRKLNELHSQLQQNEVIAITALQGMGGIGKTELALQYAIAQFRQGTYPGGICWLQARDQEILTQLISYARTNLGLNIPDDMEMLEQVTFIWQRWSDGNVLLVIDDVTDYDAVSPYLPPSDPRFKVLLTTRQNLGASVRVINIEEFSEIDAIALLKSIVGEERIESQRKDAEALCKWVGNLPLGLELLGRFLVGKEDWAISRLLKALETKRLAAIALIESKTGMTATLGVAAALELSWAELNEQEQDLGCLLGMFAVAPIPWTLVEQCYEDIEPDDLEERRDEALRDRSLIKRVGEGTYQLHQVVQEFFREKLRHKERKAIALQTAFGQVMVAQAKMLNVPTTLEQIERVRGGIVHLEETADQWLQVLSDEDKIWPFLGIQRFYEGQGNYGLAEPWHQQCLNELKQALGREHPSVATSLNNLAALYSAQGRYEEAEPLLTESLTLSKKVLGAEHPDVASSLNNLAELYRAQGRYEEAEPLYTESLSLSKRVFGAEHPSVATSLNNLAGLYRDQGRYEEAEPLYTESLMLWRKTLGAEHPSVATSLNNLAELYRAQGRYEEAESLFAESLMLWKKVLGGEHPSVATSLNNLAGLYRDQGRYEEAEPLYTESLMLSKKVLGTEHPDVATSLNNLAGLYRAQGHYEKAEPLYQQAFKMRRKLLGNEHPDIAQSLNNLAGLYRSQGRYKEAEPLYQQALKMSRRLLGNEHPDVASSLNNIALLYDNQGRYEEAEPLYQQALEMRRKLLGNAHPDVASSLLNLGVLYHQQTKYTEAEALYRQALSISNFNLGPNHPNTLIIQDWLNSLP